VATQSIHPLNTSNHTNVLQLPIPSRITQQELGHILEIGRQIKALEERLREAEGVVLSTLEAGATVEPGIFQAYIRTIRKKIGFLENCVRARTRRRLRDSRARRHEAGQVFDPRNFRIGSKRRRGTLTRAGVRPQLKRLPLWALMKIAADKRGNWMAGKISTTTSRKPLSAVSHEIPSSSDIAFTRLRNQSDTDDIARGLYYRLSPIYRRSFGALMKAVQAERDFADSILSSKPARDEAVKVEAQAKWLN